MSRVLFAAKKDLEGIVHEQTIICRQLFAGVVREGRSHTVLAICAYFLDLSRSAQASRLNHQFTLQKQYVSTLPLLLRETCEKISQLEKRDVT